VRTNIEKIGGTVELKSEAGKGSTFHIKIPLTLAIVSVLLVEANGERFAVPQINVLELVRTAADSEHQVEMISNALVLRLRDKLLPLVTLGDVLQLPECAKEEDDEEFGACEDEQYIVVCRVGGSDFGVIVDRIFDTEEIVVKPVSELLKNIDVFSGNTILGDGSVIMILDPNGLARLCGDNDGASKAHEEEMLRRRANSEQLVSFLLFKAGEGAPKAVPLELVSRLEEVDVNTIEMSGESRVIQYRGDLMRLTTLHDMDVPEKGTCEVVVFSYDNKTVGLVVEHILDIVEAPLQVKLGSVDDAYLGSMVISGKTTDVVDVGYLLRGMISDAALNDLRDQNASDECHVMLVEDSIFFRKLTVPFLTSLGYRVSAYPSAPEALEVIVQGKIPFDIIVTDIEMPEMDGFQFAERVRSLRHFDHVPIIAFTSTINEQFITRSKSVGMNDFILKTNREALVQSMSHRMMEQQEVA